MQKTAKSLLFSYYLCTFAYSNEPLKQAGGSASSDLIIRRLQQDTDIRWFPVRNLENRVISQTSDKQRWFENSSKVTKSRAKYKTNLFVSVSETEDSKLVSLISSKNFDEARDNQLSHSLHT